MPSLNFVLPHWLYWATLGIFPAIAIYLTRRQRSRPDSRRVSLFVAYLFWLCSGFVGMHRFYLRSLWGFAFMPLLALVLWGNVNLRDAREDLSSARSDLDSAKHHVDQAQKAVATEQSGAAEKLAAAEAELAEKQPAFDAAEEENARWRRLTQAFALALAAALLLDAVLIPGLVRRVRDRESSAPSRSEPVAQMPPELPAAKDPTLGLHTRFTDAIEAINRSVGLYVSYWAVIAVFVYYYEVIARYLFNSPTNWVHESMFLMFGMQYMLSGAYAYAEDAHVRVDVIYAKFSRRGKAVADIVTSFFFFVFTVTMLWTGARFALDAIQVNEHSFTEWGIEYWPVKLAIPVGAGLIVLQGLVRLAKDVVLLARREA